MHVMHTRKNGKANTQGSELYSVEKTDCSVGLFLSRYRRVLDVHITCIYAHVTFPIRVLVRVQVDLKCMVAAEYGYCYLDHLPVLGLYASTVQCVG